jgi:orotate phosphoribosyltransferase
VQEVEQRYSIPVISIASLNDVLAFLDITTPLAQQARPYRDAIEAYRQRYGV